MHARNATWCTIHVENIQWWCFLLSIRAEHKRNEMPADDGLRLCVCRFFLLPVFVVSQFLCTFSSLPPQPRRFVNSLSKAKILLRLYVLRVSSIYQRLSFVSFFVGPIRCFFHVFSASLSLSCSLSHSRTHFGVAPVCFSFCNFCDRCAFIQNALRRRSSRSPSVGFSARMSLLCRSLGCFRFHSHPISRFIWAFARR